MSVRLHVAPCTALLLGVSIFAAAQSPLSRTTHGYIDEQARISRLSQDSAAARNAVAAMFQSVGIDPALAKAFGFQERIVQAQVAYAKGAQTGIREQDIAQALNNLGSSVNAPAWSRTNTAEVHRVRVLDIALYPDLLLSHTPVSHGQTPNLLNEKMSPLEAVRVALSVIEQKLYNPEFQISTHEFANVLHSRDEALRLSAQRGQDFRVALYGTTNNKSMRDKLWIADNFFTDLKLNPVQLRGGAF